MIEGRPLRAGEGAQPHLGRRHAHTQLSDLAARAGNGRAQHLPHTKKRKRRAHLPGHHHAKRTAKERPRIDRQDQSVDRTRNRKKQARQRENSTFWGKNFSLGWVKQRLFCARKGCRRAPEGGSVFREHKRVSFGERRGLWYNAEKRLVYKDAQM